MSGKSNVKTQELSRFDLVDLKANEILEVKVRNSGLVHTLIFQLKFNRIVFARESNASYRPTFSISRVKPFILIRSKYIASENQTIISSDSTLKNRKGFFYLGYVANIILTSH